LFSLIKKQYRETKLRPWITHRICLDYAEQSLLKTYSAGELAESIESATELSREEIYTMIN